ncbi:MAG: DUF2207 domain-containing protein [Saprospiraceae bacterium]|nr:DUF2207 domain-containing protein [Saprospiraceae bacterium]MBP6693784.1 DUF2207 domain-containing protein [Saprospiraceae bacterium]
MSVSKIFIVFFSLIFFFVFPLSASDFNIKHYQTNVEVKASGILEITETIEVFFNEQRRGIFRKIPYRYMMKGEEYALKIYDIEVENYHFQSDKSGNDVVIKIGHKDIFIEGKQTYIIKYKVKGAFLFEDNFTEFQWNVTGTNWPVAIESAGFGVYFDGNLNLTKDDYFVNAGRAGTSDAFATAKFLQNKIIGNAEKVLEPGEGMTLYVKLPKDYIVRPGALEIWMQKYGWLSLASLLFISLTGFFYRLWTKYGKDYPIIRAVQYIPPKDLTPSEAGVIIDERADNVDVLALLPYWAHNGYILIKMMDKSRGKSDHQLIKVKDLPKEAPTYEHIIFDQLFSTGNEVLISSLENEFYETMTSAKTSLKQSLQSKDIYYPISIRYQLMTGVVSAILIAVGILLSFVFGILSVGIALGLAGGVGFIFTNYMVKKNHNGVRLYQETLGFKMFVKAAEKDKIERMLKDDPMYFEKTLPYAMVFGYAKPWSKKFEGLLLEPPSWYVGPGGMYYAGHFSPSEFGSSFDSSMNEIKSVFNSTPSSSGGGGFSGGGSVGGGFGGGGGGSW